MSKDTRKPIDVLTFPLYFQYYDAKFTRTKPNTYERKIGNREFNVDKKTSDELLEALMAGQIITKEEYENNG